MKIRGGDGVSAGSILVLSVICLLPLRHPGYAMTVARAPREGVHHQNKHLPSPANSSSCRPDDSGDLGDLGEA